MLRVEHCLLSVALVLSSSSAVAQELPRARLEFSASASAERCLDESQLRQLVAARLGRDPFDPTAALAVRVRIERLSSAVRATITRIEGARSSAPRVLESRRADCADIGAAVGLAVSMTIDPLARTPPIEPPATPPVQPPQPPLPPERPPAPAQPARVDPPPSLPLAPHRPPPSRALVASTPLPFALYASAGPALEFATLPTVALGPQLLLAARYGAFGAAISGRFAMAWPSTFDPFVVHSTLASGALRVCGVWSVTASRIVDIELCALGSVGAFAANATLLDRSTPTTSLYAAAGAELATSLRFGRWVGLRVGLEGAATIVRARQIITEQGRERELWLASPFSLGASVGPILYFL